MIASGSKLSLGQRRCSRPLFHLASAFVGVTILALPDKRPHPAALGIILQTIIFDIVRIVPGNMFRKIGRPIEGGLNTLATCESADVRDPFLGLRLGCGSRLCRKLEHCCCLTFKHVS